MRFSKWHALGNSYVVVERADAGAVTAERARRLCDPATGLDSDGVLEVTAVDGDTVEVVIWNPDGSTAEMSGNGTRIAARWLAERTGARAVTVFTGGRSVAARVLDATLLETRVCPVAVGEPETLDVGGAPLEVTPVSVGNPHAVARRERPSREELLRLGPLVETHERFPARTNVQLLATDGPHDVTVLVWERGAGETSASGSSAVAAAAAAVARGWAQSPVTVHMPGGDLLVSLDDGGATLTGPVELVSAGEIDL
jgi:diaminopimelate epimerase